MPRLSAFVLLAALTVGASSCRDEPEGTLKVMVIGGEPKLRDPAAGPLSVPDQVLLQNVAQGLVRFDAAGNIVSGLAERWTVSADGLSYIFRLASADWSDGRKITARDVARLMKRELGSRSRNGLKDALGAVEDVVAMTDRVIEIRLLAPRPALLSRLAQPEMAILRNGRGTGPFTAARAPGGNLKLTREIVSPDEETTTRQEVLLGGADSAGAIKAFAGANIDVVLGGTFADLPLTKRVKLPRNTLRFDPASGLFGLVPTTSGGPLDKPEVRHLLSEALERDRFIAALDVPGLAARATLLEPGLDGLPAPSAPAWTATPYAERISELQARADRLFPKAPKPAIRVALPEGTGAGLLFQLLQRDWGRLGFTVERAKTAADADFALVDEVAPSSSPSWFLRYFHCGAVPVCSPEADRLMDAARQSPVPAQRYALLGQAAAQIDEAQLFLPITAPVRWSLVSDRIENFAGNRYARHTLTDLEAKPDNGG
jgi:peptide/nickel transport system substrate-binding protein